jgi:hypothetical protein
MNIPQQIKDLQLPADDMGLLLIDDIEEASQVINYFKIKQKKAMVGRKNKKCF